MTPKEKAKELFSKYQNIYLTEESMGIDDELAKQCALIVVDEIIINQLEGDFLPPNMKGIVYWQEVKKEIEKL